MTKAKTKIEKRPAVNKRVVEESDSKITDNPAVADWQSMFAVAEHWQSDLKFFLDEIFFFRKLLDQYFIWLIKEKNVVDARQLISDLSVFEKKRASLEHDVTTHLSQLANWIQNPFAQDGHRSHDKHSDIEKSMAGFVKEFRGMKKEVFRLTEQMIDAEKMQRLLTK